MGGPDGGSGKPSGKSSLLRRLSLRRRRARSPASAPPSPALTSASRTSHSTSTSTPDIAATVAGEEVGDPAGTSPTEDGAGKSPGADDADVDAALNAVLLARLECPVCYQPMAPPIRQCVFGHSVCARCEARLARCPTCRGTFLPAAATNATLNAIALAVRLPCRYRRGGCRANLHLADKARHEDHCPLREYRCPHTPPPCPWKGTLDCLMRHTLTDHPADTALLTLNNYTGINYTYSRPGPFEVNELDHGVNRLSKTLLLVESADSVGSLADTMDGEPATKTTKATKEALQDGDGRSWTPKALFRFHLRFDATRVTLQAVLQYVGPPSNSRVFRYKVSVGSRDESFKLSAWCEASCAEVDDALADGRVLRMDSAAFRHVVDAGGRFLVRIKVAVGRLPPLLASEKTSQ